MKNVQSALVYRSESVPNPTAASEFPRSRIRYFIYTADPRHSCFISLLHSIVVFRIQCRRLEEQRQSESAQVEAQSVEGRLEQFSVEAELTGASSLGLVPRIASRCPVRATL